MGALWAKISILQYINRKQYIQYIYIYIIYIHIYIIYIHNIYIYDIHIHNINYVIYKIIIYIHVLYATCNTVHTYELQYPNNNGDMNFIESGLRLEHHGKRGSFRNEGRMNAPGISALHISCFFWGSDCFSWKKHGTS